MDLNVVGGQPQEVFPRAQFWGLLSSCLYKRSGQGDQGTCSNFVDDTKLALSVDLLEGGKVLQMGLDGLDSWTKANRMRFNKAKWQVLHMGHNHPMNTIIRDDWLETTQ